MLVRKCAPVAVVVLASASSLWNAGCKSSPSPQSPPTSSPLPTPAPSGAAAYPLHVDSATRRLLDAAGQPFFIHGDAAWSLMVRLNLTEAGSYLQDRRGRGFNAVLVNLIEHHFGGPPNRNGDPPFAVPGDFSTPNEAYFTHVEQVIDQANRRGILVLLAPMYLGYQGGDEGWYQEVLRNGTTKCRQYGRYLGQRYARFPNIVWVNGGDTPPMAATAEVDALVAGIKELDSVHLHTAHSTRGRSALDDYDRPWLDLNSTYSNCSEALSLARVDAGRGRTFFHIEGIYENEGADATCLLGQAYYSAFTGARGHVFGNRPMWLFDSGWPGALASTGAGYMSHFAALLASRDGYGLVPDLQQRIVVDGFGDPNGEDYVAAARTASGASVLIYMPRGRRITVDTASLPRTGMAWWFDPQSGASQPVGSFTGSGGLVDFAPSSSAPWVLVLDDAQRQLPAPGLVASR